MDPITMAAGTALVGAMATDAWQRTRAAVVALWRRARPEQADAVATELQTLRHRVLAARHEGDTEREEALAGIWRLQLQELLEQDPALVGELEQLLRQQMAPALPDDERDRVQAIQTARASGGSQVVQGLGDITVQPPAP